MHLRGILATSNSTLAQMQQGRASGRCWGRDKARGTDRGPTEGFRFFVGGGARHHQCAGVKVPRAAPWGVGGALYKLLAATPRGPWPVCATEVAAGKSGSRRAGAPARRRLWQVGCGAQGTEGSPDGRGLLRMPLAASGNPSRDTRRALCHFQAWRLAWKPQEGSVAVGPFLSSPLPTPTARGTQSDTREA